MTSAPEHPVCRRPHGRAAFSLVEVTLALGIVAFAFVTLLGMVPVGLTTFRSAIDASVGAQIVQKVINDAQQTDFDTLAVGATATAANGPSTRWFDDQGNELPNASGALYFVNMSVILTALPGDASPASVSTANLAIIKVQLSNGYQGHVQAQSSAVASRNQPAPAGS